MKIIINRCCGRFGLSDLAMEKFSEYTDANIFDVTDLRTNPHLVKIVEELGELASDEFSRLKVVEIPDDVDWIVQDYDGVELVAEKHRTWS